MTPKRLVYVLNIFPKLSETFIVGELAELTRRGIELRILSLLPPREELRHKLVVQAGLEEVACYDSQEFISTIKSFGPDLLHAHFATESTAKARELSLATDIPFTFTAHGYDIHRKPPADFRERASAAGAVVTVSEANAHYICTTFGVDKSKLRVIPCGVDTDAFCPAGSNNKDWAPPWVVCVARHVKVKNLGLLLDVCAELVRRRVDFRCLMIGDGPCHEELQEQRARLGLEHIVYMPGAADQEEVLKWWQRAAIGVLTSENEGMPVSLMEAASCGVPVVATRVGGIPELVIEGETGFLAPPGDTLALVGRLEKLLKDRPFAQRLGLAGRARAQEKFSVTRQVDSLLEVWSEVLQSRKGAWTSK